MVPGGGDSSPPRRAPRYSDAEPCLCPEVSLGP